MNEIYESCKDCVDFYLVYIREAHPTDGWQAFSNLNNDVIHADPKDANERAELAGVCMLKLGFTTPTLLDNMQNEVDDKYAALPEPSYVLDKEGKVYYRGIMVSPVSMWIPSSKPSKQRPPYPVRRQPNDTPAFEYALAINVPDTVSFRKC